MSPKLGIPLVLGEGLSQSAAGSNRVSSLLFNEYFRDLKVSCKSDGSFSALLRMEKVKEFRRIMESKYKVVSRAGSLLVRYDVGGLSVTYVFPDRVLFRLGPGKEEKDAREFLSRLLEAEKQPSSRKD